MYTKIMHLSICLLLHNALLFLPIYLSRCYFPKKINYSCNIIYAGYFKFFYRVFIPISRRIFQRNMYFLHTQTQTYIYFSVIIINSVSDSNFTSLFIYLFLYFRSNEKILQRIFASSNIILSQLSLIKNNNSITCLAMFCEIKI